MKFIDLQTQQQRIRKDIESRMLAVLDHGQYILGPEVKALEVSLADYVGVKHCIAVSSGTDALLIALMAYGVRAGDEVITTPFSFIATAEVIALLGAVPVFVDIEADSYNINPDLIEAAITPQTKAIMPVNLYGQCADYDRILPIAKRHNIPVIEDAAQSFGATWNGKKSCGLTDIGCTSFFPSKPLGGYGDGGACFTNDDELATVMRQISVHGQDRRYHHARVGINGRIDTLQATILQSKLAIFEDEVKLRMEVASRYEQLLGDIAGQPIMSPSIHVDARSVYAQYTVRIKHRDSVQAQMSDQGIPTAVHYPILLPDQPALKCEKVDFPVAEEATKSVMSLPMHPYLMQEDQCKVVSALAEAVKE